MRNLYILIPILFLSSCGLFKKAAGPSAGDAKKDLKEFSIESVNASLDIADTKAIITTLASDAYEGRKPGDKGFELSVAYVEQHFIANGIQPFWEAGYRDSFKISRKETYNVVGLIGEKKADEYILIGAHLDHLGKLSSSQSDNVYNGANDNASGVTAVLQISSILAEYQFDKPIIVALFSAEEDNLLGSKHLSKRLKAEGINISAVYNFEMIGKTLTTGANKVYITGFNKSNLAAEMNSITGNRFVNFLQAEISYQLFSRSDNFPFYAAYKIPSHTISTFDFKNYNHYHKVTDEVSELDIENMHQIISSCAYIIGELLKNNTGIVLNKK